MLYHIVQSLAVCITCILYITKKSCGEQELWRDGRKCGTVVKKVSHYCMLMRIIAQALKKPLISTLLLISAAFFIGQLLWLVTGRYQLFFAFFKFTIHYFSVDL